MSLQDLGSLGEFIAAIAVVASLIYVGFQIRQNTRSQKAASYQAAVDASNEFNTLLARDTELEQLFDKGLRDYLSLSETERRRFGSLTTCLMRNYALAIYLGAEGLMPKNVSRAYERRLAGFSCSPGGRAWWKDYGEFFTEEFQGHYAAWVAAQGAQPDRE